MWHICTLDPINTSKVSLSVAYIGYICDLDQTNKVTQLIFQLGNIMCFVVMSFGGHLNGKQGEFLVIFMDT